MKKKMNQKETIIVTKADDCGTLKRAEKLAWIIFFGLGLAYIVLTILTENA